VRRGLVDEGPPVRGRAARWHAPPVAGTPLDYGGE